MSPTPERPHAPIHDIADLDPEGLPSSRRLLQATGVAALIAAVVLAVAILPAEFGIDPTGLGRAMGLTALHQSDAPAATPKVATGAAAPGSGGGAGAEGNGAASEASAASATSRAAGLTVRAEELRSDVMTVSLAPRQGAEIKAVMAQGQHLVYEWTSDGGAVYVDMHGDPPNADKDTFTSFRVDAAATSSAGRFEAPFEGNHGWYWENRGDKPLTITLKTAGFYSGLFMP